MTTPGPRSPRLFGLLGVAVLGLTAYVVVGSYNQTFVPVVRAEVIADRAGLQLDRRADVTLYGVTVGDVRAVEAVDGRAVIRIAIDREYADAVPADVSARIIAPTVFGAKFVDLVPPAAPAADAIEDGAVIHARTVGTETNSVFDSVMALLTTVQPARLEATLGAVAAALRGHGSRLGEFLSDLNTYLTRFTPTLPAVAQDLRTLPEVAGTYADVVPDVLRIADDTTALSQTVQDEEAGLHALLLSLVRVSDDGRALLADQGRRLVDLLDTMRPTTQLLAYYAPSFPCMFATVNTLRVASTEAVGGQYNGIHGVVTFLPGQQGYQKGLDDPVVGADGPPRCYPALVAYGPHYTFDDGTTTPDFNRTTTEVVSPLELARMLLGPAVVPYVGGGR
ncbi:MCE family protein [Actinophytocola oryzae]|uniref:Phospholipid/cholesterol/gamma-HCH transport system substrate-binding protein n=1 Tax=Actinophytocola oryzae TaxID=502181 RepID=A0A4R7W0K3_9PSEU|nr:MCE family protein [Actinophytocola oryzae]TDV55359.1 phospholipid/cholesterol/gamma-HCH transport system substrate-binding protein [Actinophytocola oryzae]